MAENTQMTAATSTNIKHDHTCTGKKMEGGENGGLNTVVESLRGMLLAERHASRAAKQQADSLAIKFVEMEKKLREETKLRDKAQRKLHFLKKKLESLNISTHSEAKEAKPQITNPTLSENNAEQNHNLEQENVLIQNLNQSSENLSNAGSSRNSSLSPEIESSVTENEEGNDDSVVIDDSLALVPVTFAAATKNNHKPLHESSVLEALDALKRAREGLLCSMRTRSIIINVCPTH